MAIGILINDFRPEYSENILPILDGSLNINSGTNASISYDSSVYFDTGKCIKNTFIVGGDVDRITYNISDYTTTIKNTGSHILSYRFFKPSEDPSITFWVQMFVNGILTTNTTIENVLETDVFTDRWLCFAQSFDLTSGDVITFKFQAISDVIGSVIYFDALKLEYDDRNLGTPSIYSKPLDSYMPLNATGFESKTDTTNVVSLTAATDNVMSLSATSVSNGGLTFLDSNSKIIPIQLNDVLAIEFACTFETPAGTEQSIDVLLRVGTSFYRGYNYKLTKGAGNDDYFSVNWNLPCGVNVMANDVEIVLNPTSTMNYKDRYINVTRIHKAR